MAKKDKYKTFAENWVGMVADTARRAVPSVPKVTAPKVRTAGKSTAPPARNSPVKAIQSVTPPAKKYSAGTLATLGSEKRTARTFSGNLGTGRAESKTNSPVKAVRTVAPPSQKYSAGTLVNFNSKRPAQSPTLPEKTVKTPAAKPQAQLQSRNELMRNSLLWHQQPAQRQALEQANEKIRQTQGWTYDPATGVSFDPKTGRGLTGQTISTAPPVASPTPTSLSRYLTGGTAIPSPAIPTSAAAGQNPENLDPARYGGAGAKRLAAQQMRAQQAREETSRYTPDQAWKLVERAAELASNYNKTPEEKAESYEVMIALKYMNPAILVSTQQPLATREQAIGEIMGKMKSRPWSQPLQLTQRDVQLTQAKQLVNQLSGDMEASNLGRASAGFRSILNTVGGSFIHLAENAADALTNIQNPPDDPAYDKLVEQRAALTQKQFALMSLGYTDDQTAAEIRRIGEQLDEIETQIQPYLRVTDGKGAEMLGRAGWQREGAVQGLPPAGRWVAENVMSMANNALMLPTAAVNPGLPLALMGTQAAGQKSYELSRQGVPAGTALARGVVSGGIEAVTERFSVGSVLDLVKTGGKSIVLNTLKQAGVEAGEEGASYVLNYLADKAARDPNATFTFAELFDVMARGGFMGVAYGVAGTGIGKTNSYLSTQNDILAKIKNPAEAEQQIESTNTAPAETAAPPDGAVHVGRATTIYSPYEGKVPQNTQTAQEAPRTQISAETVRAAQTEIDVAAGTSQFKGTLRRTMQNIFDVMGGQRKVTLQNVTFEGKPYDVTLNRNIAAKVASDPNMSAEKLAVFKHIDEVVQQSDFVGSGNFNKASNKAPNVTRYDFFEKPISIENEPFIIRFDVEVFKDTNNFRTYRVINEIDLMPITELPAQKQASVRNASGLSGEGIPSPYNNTITLGAENVNSSQQNIANHNAEIAQQMAALDSELQKYKTLPPGATRDFLVGDTSDKLRALRAKLDSNTNSGTVTQAPTADTAARNTSETPLASPVSISRLTQAINGEMHKNDSGNLGDTRSTAELAQEAARLDAALQQAKAMLPGGARDAAVSRLTRQMDAMNARLSGMDAAGVDSAAPQAYNGENGQGGAIDGRAEQGQEFRRGDWDRYGAGREIQSARQGRGFERERQSPFEAVLAITGDRESQYGEHRGRAETSESFVARAQRESRRLIRDKTSVCTFTRTPEAQWSTTARETTSILRRQGIPCEVFSSDMEINQNGVTKSFPMQAGVFSNGVVYIDNAADMNPVEIAAHEGFHHLAKTYVNQVRAFYVRNVNNNLDMTAKVTEKIVEKIGDAYYPNGYDFTNPAHRCKIREELCAYLTGFDAKNAAETRAEHSSAFYDYDAFINGLHELQGLPKQRLQQQAARLDSELQRARAMLPGGARDAAVQSLTRQMEDANAQLAEMDAAGVDSAAAQAYNGENGQGGVTYGQAEQGEGFGRGSQDGYGAGREIQSGGQGRGIERGGQSPFEAVLAVTGDRESRYGSDRGRQEKSSRFYARAQAESRQLIQDQVNVCAFTRTPEVQWSSNARAVADILRRQGIPCEVFSGDMEVNQNGVTKNFPMQAGVFSDGVVYIDNAADINPVEIAAHEGFHHLAKAHATQVQDFYAQHVDENIDIFAESTKEFWSAIAKAYFPNGYDSSNPLHMRKIREEFCAYLAGFSAVDAQRVRARYARAFYDYDAFINGLHELQGLPKQRLLQQAARLDSELQRARAMLPGRTRDAAVQSLTRQMEDANAQLAGMDAASVDSAAAQAYNGENGQGGVTYGQAEQDEGFGRGSQDGYNAGREIQSTGQERGLKRGRQSPFEAVLAITRDRESQYGSDRGRQEESASFNARIQRESRQLIRDGAKACAYTPTPEAHWHPTASAVVNLLRGQGIPCEVFSNDMEVNQNGVTKSFPMQAGVFSDGVVYINNEADIDWKEIAWHEGFHHIARMYSVQVSEFYARNVDENLDVTTKAAETMLKAIGDAYYPSGYDLNNASHRRKIREELCAYLAGFNAVDAERVRARYASAFYDYDAFINGLHELQGLPKQALVQQAARLDAALRQARAMLPGRARDAAESSLTRQMEDANAQLAGMDAAGQFDTIKRLDGSIFGSGAHTDEGRRTAVEGGSGALDGPGKTNISPEMETKILEGQRKVKPKNEVIGGHSPNIVNNDNPNFAVEIISTNPDGTVNVKYVKGFPDGEVSKIKNNNTLFPNTWSDESIIKGIKTVGDTPTIGFRPRDGATLHRDIINGVQIEVIKVGPDITSGYPTGGGSTGLITGFDPIKP